VFPDLVPPDEHDQAEPPFATRLRTRLTWLAGKSAALRAASRSGLIGLFLHRR
jgi:hypothetical protein